MNLAYSTNLKDNFFLFVHCHFVTIKEEHHHNHKKGLPSDDLPSLLPYVHSTLFTCFGSPSLLNEKPLSQIKNAIDDRNDKHEKFIAVLKEKNVDLFFL